MLEIKEKEYSSKDSIYSKLIRATVGMVFWRPVPAAEIQKLHESALKNHEETQQQLIASQETIMKARRMLDSY